MPDTSRSNQIRAYFRAYESGNRSAVEQLLADNFRFTSPNDDAIDRSTYFERCWPHDEPARDQTIEKIVVDGDQAFVTYACATGNGGSFRNTEFFTFAGDRIASIDVYFGPAYRNGVML